MTVQEETLDLISILSKDAFNELSCKEIQDLFNKIILKLIEIKEPIIIKKKLLEPDTTSIGDMTKKVVNDNYREFQHNWNNTMMIDINRPIGMNTLDDRIEPLGFQANDDDWLDRVALPRNYDYEFKKKQNKIKNQNPHYEHFLNNQRKTNKRK